MVKKLNFKISSTGEVSIDVSCVEGNLCETLTRPFEESLGTVEAKTYKDSYYVESETENKDFQTE